MKKSESITHMEELGLNTLDYFISSNKQEVLHYLAKHAEEPLSMRTERGSAYLCPFYYQVTGEQLISLASKHLQDGYTLIIAPSLDIEGCLVFGCIGLGDTYDVIEYVKGEGKVRELYEHPNRKTIQVFPPKMAPVTQQECPEIAPILNEIYSHLRDTCYAEIPCCIEWSYYDKPVGVKNQKLICWEVRNNV